MASPSDLSITNFTRQRPKTQNRIWGARELKARAVVASLKSKNPPDQVSSSSRQFIKNTLRARLWLNAEESSWRLWMLLWRFALQSLAVLFLSPQIRKPQYFSHITFAKRHFSSFFSCTFLALWVPGRLAPLRSAVSGRTAVDIEKTPQISAQHLDGRTALWLWKYSLKSQWNQN